MIQTHPSMLHEILSRVNSSSDVLAALKSQYATSYVKYYMELAVSDSFTTIDVLNVTIKDYNYHISMAGALLLNRQTVNIISNVIMAPEGNIVTKLVQFRALSEMLYAEEAKILKNILTKNLPSMYENITHEIIVQSLI